ncbi:MAG: hypothetical protein JST14_08370 [Bacteroidetes bacterium]|nr:hypothetical protein [Bacteroidota bacterium]
MKTELVNFNKIHSAVLSLTMGFLIASCSTSSDPVTTNVSNSVATESGEDSYHNDTEDLSNAASSQTDAQLGARTTGTRTWADDRICSSTVITIASKINSNPDTLTIDFGTVGCTDAKGNIRKGKIIVMYTPATPGTNGRMKLGGTNTITTSNFSINGVTVEGTRTVKNVSPNLDGDITWEVTLTGGKLTFPDATTATREAHHFRQWFRNGTPLVFTDDEQRILASFSGANVSTSTATGTNRDGYTYAMQVTKDISYKVTCLLAKIFVATSGTKTYNITKGSEAANITVDYGDGTCDKTITITVNGKSKTETVKRDDNG